MNRPAPSSASRLRRFGVDIVVWAVCTATAWPLPTFAAAAATGSTLLQVPSVTAVDPPPNVFMMLDDSASMGDHKLPLTAGVTFDRIRASGPTVTIQGEGPDASNTWSNRSWIIHRDGDWAMRAPALNKLWYNPAIRYRPWKKDGIEMAQASIGGGTQGVHWGSIDARPDPARLTERDPRQVPVAGGYQSVTAAAGRGLLGTDAVSLAAALSEPLLGRPVTASSPSVDFRYYKMPFDFGPAQPRATTAPRNGHASYTWTVHNGRTSPLDLFSRPLEPPPSATSTGCFTDMTQCQSGASPLAELVRTVHVRSRCDGTLETSATPFASPLVCHRSRCNAPGRSGTWGGWSQSAAAQQCGYSWRDCSGVLRTGATPPVQRDCPAQRQQCDGSWKDVASDSAPVVRCFRQRGCNGESWPATWTESATPPTPQQCWRQQRCTGGQYDYFSQNGKPADRECPSTRMDCNGVVQTVDANAPPLTCWFMPRCEARTQSDFLGTTAPASRTRTCGYTRASCDGRTTETLPASPVPGVKTCYQSRSCSNQPTGAWGETEPAPTQCLMGETVRYVEAASKTVSPIADNVTAFSQTRTVTGGVKRAEPFTRVEELSARGKRDSSTITVTALTREDEQETRVATTRTESFCPTGTRKLSCQVTRAVEVPDAEALTPARYYRYLGSGDRGDPANYRVVQIDRNRPATDLYPVIDAVTGVAATAATSQRTDCRDRTRCTWAEEAQNFANWWLYYRNRMFATQAVVADAMSSLTTSAQQQLRVGYGRINQHALAGNPWRTETIETAPALPSIDGFSNPGALVRGVRSFTVGSRDRADFFDWLFSLAWARSTPNREAIDSIGRYFAWTDDRGPWGAKPGTADRTPHLACRRNFAFLATDGEWTHNPANQPILSAAGPLGGPGTPVESDNIAGPTIPGDGPNAGSSFTYRPGDWLPLTSAPQPAQSGTLTDVTVYYWSRDLRPDLPNVIRPTTGRIPNPAFWQSMSTYIIGYGLSTTIPVETARAKVVANDPRDTVAWPTVDLAVDRITDNRRVEDSLRAALASRGNFYAASDTEELRQGLQDGLSDMQAQIGSAGGIAVTGAAVTSTTQAFFPSYETSRWTGQLRAYSARDLEALAAGQSPAEQWRASVPAPSARTVLTATGRSAGALFEANALNAAQRTLLTGTNHTAAELVAYLRGDTSREVPPTGPAAGRGLRARNGQLLGAFINSNPLYVRAPDYQYAAMPTIGTTYPAYVANRRNARSGTVYIGGNAGLFHAFDSADGRERFAYVPRGVYEDLPALADPAYSPRYFVDGPVVAGDWHDGTRWRSVVVGTTGAGGAGRAGGGSIFALDVTDPGAMDASKVMWDLTKAEDRSIGHVLSRGFVGRVRTGAATHSWVYVVGNGYESASGGAALLVIDLKTGALLKSIPAGPAPSNAQDPATRNGLGGITVAYDGERNIRTVYGGDRLGRLWRFDFSERIPDAPKDFAGGTSALFTAASGGRAQSISAAPRLVPHPLGGRLIVFGTGRLQEAGDAANVDTQAIYALWEKPQHRGAVTPDQLEPLSVAGGELARIDWTRRMGWRLDLPAGERVVSDPISEVGTLSVATFKPGSGGDSCSGGGASTLYRLDLGTATYSTTTIAGVMGVVSPITDITPRRRTIASAKVSDLISGAVASQPGEPAAASVCKLYGAAIQGQPAAIPNQCPAFRPLRVWRQPTVVQ